MVREECGLNFLQRYIRVYIRVLLQETTAIWRDGGNYDRSSVPLERTRAWFQCQLIRSSGRFTLKLAHRLGKCRLFNRAGIDAISRRSRLSVSIIFVVKRKYISRGYRPIGSVLSDNRINRGRSSPIRVIARSIFLQQRARGGL